MFCSVSRAPHNLDSETFLAGPEKSDIHMQNAEDFIVQL